MIKINLLGEDTSKDNSGVYILIAYAASMVLLFVIFAVLYSSISTSIADLEVQAQSLEQQLNKLKTVTKEVRELEAKKNELRNKLAVIATLKQNKIGPVRVMDDLNKSLPERAWITDIRERENALQITGRSLDEQTVAAFMRALEQSDYFVAVDLVESKKASWKGVNMSQFTLDAKINYAGKLAQQVVDAAADEKQGGSK